jgi:hypothetical protein
MSGKQYQFDFDAFGVDIKGENNFKRATMVSNLVVAEIPSGGTLITREMYNAYEAQMAEEN